jgi:integrase
LAELTPANIQQWKLSFVASAGDDPVRQRSARISANSFLRRAKSLFAPSVTKHLEKVSLPNPLPFDGVDFYKRASMRYQGSFDVFDLIEAAKKELAQPAPELFKVFLLAVMAGLRRREIDTLEWSAFRWERGTIRIERLSQQNGFTRRVRIPSEMWRLIRSLSRCFASTTLKQKGASSLSQR